jgi:hypothetical protein
LPESVANGPDAVRDRVRTMVRAGADVIKTATTGGASSRPGHGPKDAAFSREEMLALVAESHALGRRVMCHALGGPGLRTAVLAGVDSIEHGSYLDEAYNPSDFQVNAAAINPWMDPALSTELPGAWPSRSRRCEVGLGHVMGQASWGGLAHDKAMASLRRFGEHVAPAYRDSQYSRR